MTRKQFIQTLIIAPIVGFFGVKAMAKKNDHTQNSNSTDFQKQPNCKLKIINAKSKTK